MEKYAIGKGFFYQEIWWEPKELKDKVVYGLTHYHLNMNHDHGQVESFSQLFNEDGWDQH